VTLSRPSVVVLAGALPLGQHLAPGNLRDGGTTAAGRRGASAESQGHRAGERQTETELHPWILLWFVKAKK
jgi:hypothetical protein